MGGGSDDYADWVRKPVISLDASVAGWNRNKPRVGTRPRPQPGSRLTGSPSRRSQPLRGYLAQGKLVVSIASENSTYSSPLHFGLAKRTWTSSGARPPECLLSLRCLARR